MTKTPAHQRIESLTACTVSVSAVAALAPMGIWRSILIRRLYDLVNMTLLLSAEGGDNVAQYGIRAQAAAESLMDLLELAVQVHPDAPLPSQHAIRDVLRVRAALQSAESAGRRPQEDVRKPAAVAPRRKLRPRRPAITSEPTKNTELVLQAVTQLGRARVRDIIQACSSVSPRTVKRQLKELLNGGSIRKTEDGKATFYESAKS